MQNRSTIYGHARVSTAAQDESGQVHQLKAAGCERIFREKITGTAGNRPQLGKLMKKIVERHRTNERTSVIELSGTAPISDRDYPFPMCRCAAFGLTTPNRLV